MNICLPNCAESVYLFARFVSSERAVKTSQLFVQRTEVGSKCGDEGENYIFERKSHRDCGPSLVERLVGFVLFLLPHVIIHRYVCWTDALRFLASKGVQTPMKTCSSISASYKLASKDKLPQSSGKCRMSSNCTRPSPIARKSIAECLREMLLLIYVSCSGFFFGFFVLAVSEIALAFSGLI